MAYRVLLDVNICLDLLLNRKPHVLYSGQIFEAGEKGFIKLVISGLCFDTLFYVMRPVLGARKSIEKLQLLLGYVHVGMIHHNTVQQVLDSGWSDLEDALHYYCALQNDCLYIITRNKKDFKRGTQSVIIVTPEEFLGSNQFLGEKR